AKIKLSSQTGIQKQPVQIRWQGCAKAGLCYPPETTTVQISLNAHDGQVASASQTATKHDSATTQIAPHNQDASSQTAASAITQDEAVV
ncbi:hypothetical protein NL392_34005, partial [Klebsiella pneumoniae]|nr:hypothetical protein [Klebsiella pneumoniae]